MAKSKRRKAGKKNTAGLPGWIHMLAGLAIGLTVAWGIYVSDRRQPPIPAPVAQESEPEAPPAEVTEIIPEASEEAVTFDFYDMLPNLDVELYEDPVVAKAPAPVQPLTVAETQPVSQSESQSLAEPVAPTPAAAPAAAPVSASTARIVEKPGIYILQAGSFTSLEVAQRRKTEINALGVQSEIKKGTVNDKTVYRVYTAPMDSPGDVNRVSTLLSGVGIDILMKRVSD